MAQEYPIPESGQESKKPPLKNPTASFFDKLVRIMRRSRSLRILYRFVAHQLVPFVLMIFVVGPIILVLLPFIILDFVRSSQLRRKYEVRLLSDGSLRK